MYYCGILEGLQSDQDFLRLMFSLERTAARQCFCMYCDSLQWVTLKSPMNALNNLESLYTIFGPREGDCEIISPESWTQLHGETPLCKIIGWDPSRHQSSRSQFVSFFGVAKGYIHIFIYKLKNHGHDFGQPSPGIFPDYMHIMHLACSVDAICSVLLDLSDGGNRDRQLAELWESYKTWCEAARFLDQTTFNLSLVNQTPF